MPLILTACLSAFLGTESCKWWRYNVPVIGKNKQTKNKQDSLDKKILRFFRIKFHR